MLSACVCSVVASSNSFFHDNSFVPTIIYRTLEIVTTMVRHKWHAIFWVTVAPTCRAVTCHMTGERHFMNDVCISLWSFVPQVSSASQRCLDIFICHTEINLQFDLQQHHAKRAARIASFSCCRSQLRNFNTLVRQRQLRQWSVAPVPSTERSRSRSEYCCKKLRSRSSLEASITHAAGHLLTARTSRRQAGTSRCCNPCFPHSCEVCNNTVSRSLPQ